MVGGDDNQRIFQHVEVTEVLDKLADVFIYVCMMANELGIDLEETYKIKREMNVGRFGTSSEDLDRGIQDILSGEDEGRPS